MVMIAADYSTNTSETMSYENGSSLCDDSFSSYSNEADDTFVLQLEQSSRHFDSFSSVPHENLQLGRKKTEEYGEIGVYGAERYFNEEVNEGIPKDVNNSSKRYKNNKDNPTKIRALDTRTPSGTPSVRSQMSWSSRSSLLKIPRNQKSPKVSASRAKNFLTRLGFKCSCRDKESVKVDNNNTRVKATRSLKNGNLSQSKKNSKTSLAEDRRGKRSDEARRVLHTSDHISSPVINANTGFANKLHLQEDKRRKSSEVFGSPITIEREKSVSLERRIARLSWDAIPPREVEIEIPEISNGKYNDTDSDASSDLFEIESFSTNTNPYISRQASDGVSINIPSTICYPPGNAADFSVISDTREIKATITKTSFHINALDGKNISGKEIPEPCPNSILSGCKNQESFRVAEEAYRTSDNAFPNLQH